MGIYFDYSIIFLTAVFLGEGLLNIRQHFKFYEKTIPVAIEKIVDKETFEKARVYGLDKSWFRLAQSVFNHLETLITLYYGFLPYMWALAGQLLLTFGLDSSFEITQSILFLYLTTFYQLVITLPWNLYYTFVLEEKHGFNKQTFSFYARDQLKSMILNLVVTAIIIAPLLLIIRWGGEFFYVYAWFFFFLFSLFAITIYADFIAPLFDTFTALSDGPLRKKIEALAGPLQFPLTQIWVIDASQRSSHSNAYIYGFFNNKRIVLFDTLFPKAEEEEKSEETTEPDVSKKDTHLGCSDDEIVAVLSHELGHWKLNHTVKSFVIAQFNVFFSFLLFGILMDVQEIYSDFGFIHSKPLLIGLLIILQFIFAPINVVLGFLITKLTRKHEFEADAFAKDMGYTKELKSALIKLQVGNLGDMNPDPWYSNYHFSHPPLVERLNALEEPSKPKKD